MTRFRDTLSSLDDASALFQSLAPDAVKAMEEEGARVGEAANDVARWAQLLGPQVQEAARAARDAARAVEAAAESHRQITDVVYAALVAVAVGLALGYLVTGAKEATAVVRRYFG